MFRGAMFHSLLVAVRSTRGSEAEARIRRSLPPSLAEATREGWYPIADLAAVHTLIDESFGGGEECAEKLGRAATEHDLSGLLGFILSITSPHMLVRYCDIALRIFFRDIGFETTKLAANQFRLEMKGIGANRLMHAAFASGTCLLLQRTGARDPRVSRFEIKNDVDCILEFSWEE